MPKRNIIKIDAAKCNGCGLRIPNRPEGAITIEDRDAAKELPCGCPNITHAHMEAPCCFGLVSIIKSAISASGKNIPFQEVTISIKREKLE